MDSWCPPRRGTGLAIRFLPDFPMCDQIQLSCRAREGRRFLALAPRVSQGFEWESDLPEDDAVAGLGDFRRLRTVPRA
jgi:hypothetical protein